MNTKIEHAGYSKLSGMHVITCGYYTIRPPKVRYPGEAKGCIEEFRSASIERVIPKQLDSVGWSVVTEGSKKYALCPMHAERIGLSRRRMPRMRQDDTSEPDNTKADSSMDENQLDLPMTGLLDSGSLHK